MAKKNNNRNGNPRYSLDQMIDSLNNSSDYESFIGVDFSRIYRQLIKTHKAMTDSAKKEAKRLAEEQLKAEKEKYNMLVSRAEKQRAVEIEIARLREQQDSATGDRWIKIAKQREEAENKLSSLKKQQVEYEEKWQKKLEQAKGTGARNKKETRIESEKKYRDNLEKQYSEAVSKGDENTAEAILKRIEIVSADINKAERRREFLQKAVDTIGGDLKKLGNSIQNSLNSLYDEQVKFNARTTSSDDAYGNMLEDISKLIGASPFIKQTDVIKNLSEIANTGSNYNIEQRAYLATLAKDIASTFDATQPELLRLNRLLHTDLTSVMFGMEQNLTAALNNTFNDSSFMNSLRDAVASGVLDAQSQLSSGQGTDFTWAVQTWMGALTSAGVSDDVINMLTQGLNYLGSGNVSAMSGNEQLQTLFALAASNAGGKSYSEMLVDGIDASDVNRLMAEMISYLKEIASENKVVQSEYFRILGLGGLSNMTALGNIDVAEVLNIAQNSRTNINTGYYSTSSLLNRVNVVKDNLVTTMAADLGESVPKLATWLIADALDEFVGGIKLPSFTALGTGVILDTTVADIMKTALMASTIPSLFGSIGSAIGNNGIADFGAFQEQAGGITTGFGTSVSYAVGSSSSSDIMKSSITSQAKMANENKKTVSNAIGEKEEDTAENQLKSIRDNVGTLKDTTVLMSSKISKSFNDLFEKFDNESDPIQVQVKDLSKITEAITQDKVQRVEGTVRLAGFDREGEETLNDVLTNAIALAIKMIIGGATSPDASTMYMESGFVGNEYMGGMTLMEFLNRIIESNTQTQEQISNTFDYFTQQKDSSYIR